MIGALVGTTKQKGKKANKMKPGEFMMDSGSLVNIVPDAAVLSETEPSTIKRIVGVGGNEVEVTAKGTYKGVVRTTDGKLVPFVLKDVLVVPRAIVNIVSIRKLTQSGFAVDLHSKTPFISKGGKEIHLKDRKGVLILDLSVNSPDDEEQGDEEETLSGALSIKDEYNLWHGRMAHINPYMLRRMAKGSYGLPERFRMLDIDRLKKCSHCALSKATNNVFRPIDRNASKPTQIVHADLFGPVDPISLGGNKYGLIIVDENTRLTKFYPVSSKE